MGLSTPRGKRSPAGANGPLKEACWYLSCVTEDLIRSKPWKHHIARKLPLAFWKLTLIDKILTALRSLSDESQTLSTQILSSISLKSWRQTATSQKAYQEVEKYKVMGQASQQIYEDLDKACTKHTEHQDDFCVGFNQVIINGYHGV